MAWQNATFSFDANPVVSFSTLGDGGIFGRYVSITSEDACQKMTLLMDSVDGLESLAHKILAACQDYRLEVSNGKATIK